MSLRPVAWLVLAAFLLLAAVGCGEPILPPATATPPATDTASPTATATAQPIPTATPTASPTPLRTASGLTYANLGLPGGDAFSPIAVAADKSLRRVYVYSSYNDQDGEDTLSVLQLGSLTPVGSVRLGGTQRTPSLASQLAVDPVSHRVYAQNADRHALVVVDGASLTILAVIQGVRRMALATDSGRIFVLNDLGQIKCLSAADYRVLASIDWTDGFEPDRMVYNPTNDSLYLGRWSLDDKGSLTVLNGTTLAKSVEIALPSAPLDLEVDPAANEVYVATNAGVTIVDAAANKIAQSLNLSIASFHPVRSLALDPGAHRLYLSFNAGIMLPTGGGLIGIDLSTRTVLQRTQTRHFWQHIRFEPDGGVLYAVPAMNDALLVADRQGNVQERAMLGLRLLSLAIDPVTGQVWSVDSGGTLHVLDGQSLQELRRQDHLIGSPNGAVESSDLALVGGSAYVSDPDQKQTLLVDAQTLEVRQRLRAAGPLAFDSQGQRLFVADGGVKVFGLGTGKPIAQIAVPAETPDGAFIDLQFEPIARRLYAKLRSGVNASLYRTSWRAYDGQGRSVVNAFGPDYRDIEGLAAVPAANRVYVAYSGSSDWDQGLTVYDGAGAEQERLRGIHGQLLAGSGGEQLFVLRDNALWLLDRAKLEPLALLPLDQPCERMALDAQGQALYLSSGAKVIVQPLAALLSQGLRSVQQLPHSMGLSASTYRSPLFDSDATLFAVLPGEGVYRSLDGGQSWVLSSRGLRDLNVTELKFSPNYASDQMLFVTTRNATYLSRDRGQSWSQAPTWAPTFALVYDSDGKAEIYIMNADGSQIRRLGKDGVRGTHPSWSPDNNWIAFAANRTGSSNIYVIQVDGQGLARATSGSANDTEPAWSPNGAHIAFTSDRDGASRLYLMDADGGNLRRLTTGPATDRDPAWSPDSARLAFTSSRGGHDQIYVLSLDSGQAVTVTTGPAPSYNPAWSPDGQWLAFVSERNGNPDVFRAHPDGSELVQVTSAPSEERWPTWSPDSRSLIFSSNKTGRFQLYQVDLNGSAWRRVRSDPVSETQAAWIHR